MWGWAEAYAAEPAVVAAAVFLAVLAAVLCRPVAARLGWSTGVTFGAMLGLGAVLALTLAPAPGSGVHGPAWNALVRCGRDLSTPGQLWQALISTDDRGERLGNMLMFLPFSFFVTVGTRRPVRTAAVAGLLPIAVEFGQVLIGAGRTCAGKDWVDNAIGAVLGALVAAAVLRLSPARRSPSRTTAPPRT